MEKRVRNDCALLLVIAAVCALAPPVLARDGGAPLTDLRCPRSEWRKNLPYATVSFHGVHLDDSIFGLEERLGPPTHASDGAYHHCEGFLRGWGSDDPFVMAPWGSGRIFRIGARRFEVDGAIFARGARRDVVTLSIGEGERVKSQRVPGFFVEYYPGLSLILVYDAKGRLWKVYAQRWVPRASPPQVPED